ncbi:MAG TPA: DinB family protein [Bryobacteraceae bacterium]|nr:DinB family protein [Bryobacteraceae bacterium]
MAIPYEEFVGNADPFAVLETTASRIAEMTAGLSPEQIAAAPAPGKWSIHQIVAHLADAELVGQGRIRFMLFEDNPPLQSWDQDRWMQGWNREGESWEASLDRFRVLREATLRLLRAIPESDRHRTGVHSERGLQTAWDQRILHAGHDINHLRQIEAAAGRGRNAGA